MRQAIDTCRNQQHIKKRTNTGNPKMMLAAQCLRHEKSILRPNGHNQAQQHEQTINITLQHDRESPTAPHMMRSPFINNEKTPKSRSTFWGSFIYFDYLLSITATYKPDID